MSAIEDDTEVLDHLAGDDLATAPQTGQPAGRSVVDRIRARHDRRERTLDMSIPEWEGDVVVRYGRVSKSALIRASRRKGAVTSAAELLMIGCLEVFVRDEQGRLIPAREADGHPDPVRYDGRLAEMFALQGADVPQKIVRLMFADDVALIGHANRLMKWQTGDDLDEQSLDEVEDDLGEANAAT